MLKRSTLQRGLFPLIALSLALSGCGRVVSTSPELVTNSSNPASLVAQRPSLPKGVAPVSVTVTPNQAAIAVGEQRRFDVAIKGSDGQTYKDPRLVTWSISDPQAGIIDDQGVFTPQVQRVVTIHAGIMDKFADATLTITPAVYTWQQVQSPTVADLYGVKMVTNKEAWVAGSGGTVIHLLNGTWQVMSYPIPQTYTWRSVDFANPGTGWIVGYQGDKPDGSAPAVSLAFRDGYWVPTPVGVNGALLSVSSVARNNAWAVGRDGNGKLLIMHWTGSRWSRDNSYAGSGQLNAVQMLGTSDGWAVGKEGHHVLTLHYDGVSWQKVSLPPFFEEFASTELNGLSMLNGQQGYAVGKKVDMLGVTHGLMMYYDGRSSNTINFSDWSEKKAAGNTKYLDQVPLHGISMIDTNKGWLLGAVTTPNRTEDPGAWLGGTINDVYGNLLGFNGVSYDIDNNFQHYNLSSEFMGIHMLPEGDGCIVGRRGYIMQRAYDWHRSPNGNPFGMGSATGSTYPGQSPPYQGGTPYPGSGQTSPYPGTPY